MANKRKNPSLLSAEDRRLSGVLHILGRVGAFRVIARELDDGYIIYELIDPRDNKRLCFDDVPPVGRPRIDEIRRLVCEAMSRAHNVSSGLTPMKASYYHGSDGVSYVALLKELGFDEKTKTQIIKNLKQSLESSLESIIEIHGVVDPKFKKDLEFSQGLLYGDDSKKIREKMILAPEKKNITDLKVFGRYAAELKTFASIQTQKNLLKASIDKIKERAKNLGKRLSAEDRKQIDMFQESISKLDRESADFLSEKTPIGKILEGWNEYAGAFGSSSLPVGEYRFDINRGGHKWRASLQLFIISGFVRPEDVKRELDSAKRDLASIKSVVEKERASALAIGKDPSKESEVSHAKMVELEKQVELLSQQYMDVKVSKSPSRKTTFWMFWLPSFVGSGPIDYKKTFDFDGADAFLKSFEEITFKSMPSFQLDDSIKAKKFLEDQVDKQLAWFNKNNIKPVFRKSPGKRKQEELEKMLATSGHAAYRKVLTDPKDWSRIVRVIQERKNRGKLRQEKTLRGLESQEFGPGKKIPASDIEVGDQIWFNNGWRTVFVVAGDTDRSVRLERVDTNVIVRIEYAGEDDDGRRSPRELTIPERSTVLIRKPLKKRAREETLDDELSRLLSDAQRLMILKGISPMEKGQQISDVKDRIDDLAASLRRDLGGARSLKDRTMFKSRLDELDKLSRFIDPASPSGRSSKFLEPASSDQEESGTSERASKKLSEIKRGLRVYKPKEKKKSKFSLRRLEGDPAALEAEEKRIEQRHKKRLGEKAKKLGVRSELLKSIDDIDAQLRSAQAEMSAKEKEYQDAVAGGDIESRKILLQRLNSLDQEISRLSRQKERALSGEMIRGLPTAKKMKEDEKKRQKKTKAIEAPGGFKMIGISMKDPMFDMSTIEKTREAKLNIMNAYSDRLITRKVRDKLMEKADRAMEKHVDESLGIGKFPKKNPRGRDVDDVLFQYKFSEITKSEAKKRLKLIGLSQAEIDALLKHITRSPKKNPPIAEYRARRAKAQAEISRARAEAARARAEARAAAGSRRVKKDSEAIFPRLRQAYEKYIVGEEEPELADQELLSEATEIAEKARDLLDQWRESVLEARSRGTMPQYNKLVAAYMDALLSREAFMKIDETTKAGQMNTLRMRIQREIVDIMEGRKNLGQVQKASERLADAGESAAGTVTALGSKGGMVSTGARVSNPGREVHDKNAHKLAKKSVSKWGKYCNSGKCSDLVDAYADMVMAHREFDYVGDKKSAKQIATGMKRARSEMTRRLKSGIKAA